ncbi:hypothetical protein FOA52_014790 [Chlamydomonas sp. UWO 241]|nr:hypothetical protein FOA52_014790 [Chlamydomonas sp. UWO 241]
MASPGEEWGEDLWEEEPTSAFVDPGQEALLLGMLYPSSEAGARASAQRAQGDAVERDREDLDRLAALKHKLKHRDQQLVDLQTHADMLTAELSKSLSLLHAESERCAAVKDQVAALQDRVVELTGHLKEAGKRIEVLGEDDRHVQHELQQLQREHGETQSALSRCRVDLSEARARAVAAEQDAHAARAAGGGSGRLAELEFHNRQLAAELGGLREATGSMGMPMHGLQAAQQKQRQQHQGSSSALGQWGAAARPGSEGAHAQQPMMTTGAAQAHMYAGGGGGGAALPSGAAPPLAAAAAAGPHASLGPGGGGGGAVAGVRGARGDSVRDLLYGSDEQPQTSPGFRARAQEPAPQQPWGYEQERAGGGGGGGGLLQSQRQALSPQQQQQQQQGQSQRQASSPQHQQQGAGGAGSRQPLQQHHEYPDYPPSMPYDSNGAPHYYGGEAPSPPPAPFRSPPGNGYAYGRAPPPGGAGMQQQQPVYDTSGPGYYDDSPPPSPQQQQQARASAIRGPLLYGGGGPARDGNCGAPADIDAALARRFAIEERLAALQAQEDSLRAKLSDAHLSDEPSHSHAQPRQPGASRAPVFVDLAQHAPNLPQFRPHSTAVGGGPGPSPGPPSTYYRPPQPSQGAPPAGPPGPTPSGTERSPGATQRQVPLAAHGTDLLWGTQIRAREMLARSKGLEDALVERCWEKSQLEGELSKLPPGCGRTQRDRLRKAEVESRLGSLDHEISAMRMQLKKLTGR